ncbi:hypothetical protein A6D6_03479 [Alcanivorax xiamenensis]|uniref:AP2 domain-containing protein n=1 Tax=Alcanivorax xiamenensis TaxID=1177156 RepID=A0ABQ6Y483_9GAMM|nr:MULTISPECIES: hypothetical protein [Alcanivorax]KAF0804014.1 hypothetical protein A6D6_03479 [Alcanivorax xiamenensis]
MNISTVTNPKIHPFLYVYRSREDDFWWCAIPYVDKRARRRQKRCTFRDSKFGSTEAALYQARLWRDRQIQRPEVRAAMGKHRPLILCSTDELDRMSETRNPFGLVGITATFRDKPLGGNFSVTANRGRKKWFSMRRYGGYGAFRRAVEQRCRWVGEPMPDEEDLKRRYQHWARRNRDTLISHRVET